MFAKTKYWKTLSQSPDATARPDSLQSWSGGALQCPSLQCRHYRHNRVGHRCQLSWRSVLDRSSLSDISFDENRFPTLFYNHMDGPMSTLLIVMPVHLIAQGYTASPRRSCPLDDTPEHF